MSDGVIGKIDPPVLSFLVLTGALASFSVAGLATGSLDLAMPAEAWLWLVLIAVVSTVVAVSCFFAGDCAASGRRRRRSCRPSSRSSPSRSAFLALNERLTPRSSPAGRSCWRR